MELEEGAVPVVGRVVVTVEGTGGKSRAPPDNGRGGRSQPVTRTSATQKKGDTGKVSPGRRLPEDGLNERGVTCAGR